MRVGQQQSLLQPSRRRIGDRSRVIPVVPNGAGRGAATPGSPPLLGRTLERRGGALTPGSPPLMGRTIERLVGTSSSITHLAVTPGSPPVRVRGVPVTPTGSTSRVAHSPSAVQLASPDRQGPTPEELLALAAEPHSGRAWRAIVIACQRSNDLQQLRQRVTDFVRQYSSNGRVVKLATEAMQYAGMGEEALHILRERGCVHTDETDPPVGVYAQLCVLDKEHSRMWQARVLAAAQTRGDAAGASALLLVANALRKRGSQEALPLYKTVLRIDAVSQSCKEQGMEASFRCADVLVKMHKYDQAHKYLTRLLAEDSLNHGFAADARLLMSMVHLSSEEYIGCVQCCEEVSKLDSTGRGNPSTLGDDPRAAANRRRRRVLVGLLSGTAKLRFGDVDGAIATLSQSGVAVGEELDASKSSMASLNSSVTAPRGRDGESRERHFEVDTLDALGIAYALNRNLLRAAEHLERGLSLEPRHPTSLCNLGYVRQLQGRTSEALALYNHALEVDPHSAMALLRQGECHMRSGEAAQAVDSLISCTQLPACLRPLLAPPSLEGAAHLCLCVCFHLAGDATAAAESLRRGRELHYGFRAYGDLATATPADWAYGGRCRLPLFYIDLTIEHAGILLQYARAEAASWPQDEITSGRAALSSSRATSNGSSLGERVTSRTTSRTTSTGSLVERAPALTTSRSLRSPLVPQLHPEGRTRLAWQPSLKHASSHVSLTSTTDPGSGRVTRTASPSPTMSPEPAAMAYSWLSAVTGDLSQLAPALGNRQLDPAEVHMEECLASGAYAHVYRGHYRGEVVAAKRLIDGASEDGASELAAEIAALTRLEHRRIVRMVGACLGHPGMLLTEYVAGGSLHQLLHGSNVDLAQDDLLRIGKEIAEAVEYLHSQDPPLVHRDLKSMNVLLEPPRTAVATGFQHSVRLCDFGLLRPLEIPAEGGPAQVIVAADRRTAGSWRYMAPECYDPAMPLTEKADVWAVGCLLLELFSREVPYHECASAQQVAARVLVHHEAPSSHVHIPEALRQLIGACHAWDSMARPSAAEVSCDLFGNIHTLLQG